MRINYLKFYFIKKLLKFSVVAACFLAALLVNVSINANKGAGDAKLVGFASEANAGCEKDPNGLFNDGQCDSTVYGGKCIKGLEWNYEACDSGAY